MKVKHTRTYHLYSENSSKFTSSIWGQMVFHFKFIFQNSGQFFRCLFFLHAHRKVIFGFGDEMLTRVSHGSTRSGPHVRT